MILSNILKDFIRYGGSILGTSLILFLTSTIISARILGPENYGLWIALSLILQYGAYLHFGIGNALVKEVSFSRGKNDLQASERIKSTAFCAIIIISLIASIIIFFFSVTSVNKYDKNTLAALRFIAVLLIIQQIYEYFRRYFMATNNFKAAAELKISLALLSCFLTAFFVIKFNFIGIPLALIFSYSLVLLYMAKRYNIAIKPRIDIKRSLSLVKIGFPILAASIVYDLFLSIDRILILRYFGKLNLGYYSLVCMIQDFLGLLLFALGDVVFVNLSRRYGATNNVLKLKDTVCGSTIFLAYILSLILAVSYVFLPLLVKIVLPQYFYGVNLARIALIGIFFLYLSFMSGEFLFAINKQVHYFFLLLSALILKIVVSYISIVKQMGINGLLSGMVIVYFLFSNIIMIYSFLYFKEGLSKLIKYLVKIYMPFSYILLILFSFHYLIQKSFLVTLNEINRISISFLFLALLLLPLILYSFKIFILEEKVTI